jgi:hypothetical protein
MGELNFEDEDDMHNHIVICANQSIKGDNNFVLISNDTLDDTQTDIYYHSSMSRHAGIVLLIRLSKQPYHYSDACKRISPKSDSITNEQNSSSVSYSGMTILTVEETDSEASIAKIPHRCQGDCNLA